MATFLVVHPYLDIYGGGERVCHDIIKTLVNHGQDVVLLTFDFDANRYSSIMGDKFPSEVTVYSMGKRVNVKSPFTIYKRHRNLVSLLKKYRDTLHYDFLFSTQSSSPFEPVFLKKARRNIAYVHFPEIDFAYDHSSLKRKIYLWLFKKWIAEGAKKLDVVFCNSNYTKEMIERYWSSYGIREPIVVYPPVDLNAFWFGLEPEARRKRVVYVGRFIPQKRHELMKQLAVELPEYEFVSVGGLLESEKVWFREFSESIPENYILKPNLPRHYLIELLHESRIYVHLVEGEHFGIAPMEALASGCITLAHDSGGVREFLPEEFRWGNYDELKKKIVTCMETSGSLEWPKKRVILWDNISILNPERFQNEIWRRIEAIL